MTDTEIIDLFFARSEQAIEALDRKHGAAVTRVARNILGNAQDAEECVNDTYLGAWNTIPPRRPDPLRTFVCKIARNLAVTRYHADTAQKRNSRYDLALDELEEVLCGSGGVEESLEAKELAEAINAFLAGLSRSERFLFMRRYWYADAAQTIADMTGSTAGSVTVRLYRIRKKLRRFLKKEGLAV